MTSRDYTHIHWCFDCLSQLTCSLSGNCIKSWTDTARHWHKCVDNWTDQLYCYRSLMEQNIASIWPRRPKRWRHPLYLFLIAPIPLNLLSDRLTSINVFIVLYRVYPTYYQIWITAWLSVVKFNALIAYTIMFISWPTFDLQLRKVSLSCWITWE